MQIATESEAIVAVLEKAAPRIEDRVIGFRAEEGAAYDQALEMAGVFAGTIILIKAVAPVAKLYDSSIEHKTWYAEPLVDNYDHAIKYLDVLMGDFPDDKDLQEAKFKLEVCLSELRK